jgi:hypothetical protein
MNTTDHDNPLRWVRERMPEECGKAIARFVIRNPHWQGAGWDDALDVLMDSDSHLEITEPLWDVVDRTEVTVPMPLVTAVAITFHYADETWFLLSPVDQLGLVVATIEERST